MENEIEKNKGKDTEKKVNTSDVSEELPKTETREIKKEEKKKEKTKIKKEEAKVYGKDLPVSMKVGREICRFIKNKSIENAIEYLELVKIKKKPIPMRGEYGHKKGLGIAGGKYPLNASIEFVKLLKNLKANSNVNGLDEPIIAEAIANIASRPYGKGGRVRKKRCHVLIIAREKKKAQKIKDKGEKK